jgi:NAD(P)-dependent dehydrogenase (short-subunit alcohol dehydrogenase family)
MSVATGDLEGRTAVVTGASSGLGVTFAEALAEAGADVVVAARRAERLEELAGRLEERGGRAMAVTCDVADPEQVAALMAAAVDRFRRIDVLVNNAGTCGDAGPMAERLPHELFEWTVRVNLLGTWYCCRDGGAVMLRQGSGSIVNVSSVAGVLGAQHFAPAYQATKAAVINLTRNRPVVGGARRPRQRARAGLVPQRDDHPVLRHARLLAARHPPRAAGAGRRPR